MNPINWPAPSVLVFIAQLVEYYSANAETTGSNLNEAQKISFSGYFAIAFNLKIAITTAINTSSFNHCLQNIYTK